MLMRHIHVLSSKAPKTESKPDPATEQEDYYKTFRMNVLFVWILSNVSDNRFESYRAIYDFGFFGARHF